MLREIQITLITTLPFSPGTPEEAFVEASQVVLEEVSDEASNEVFKGHVKSHNDEIQIFQYWKSSEGLKNNIMLSSIQEQHEEWQREKHDIKATLGAVLDMNCLRLGVEVTNETSWT